MIGDNLLEKIRKGDPEAIGHFGEIVRIDGVVGPEEVHPLQLAAISAALAQSGRGKGAVLAKVDIYFNIFDKLCDIRSRDTIGKMAEGVQIDEPDAEIAKSWTYDKLMMLAICGPQKDKEGLPAPYAKLIQNIEDNSYSAAIQIGKVLAVAKREGTELDPAFASLANRCLANAAKFADGETAFYAIEAIGIAGNEESRMSAVNRLIDMIEFNGPREQAMGTLMRYFGDDPFAKIVVHEVALENAEVRSILSSIAKGEGKAAEAAGRIMGDVRTENEVEWMKADKETILCDYPEFSPQRTYLECMFQAIETVMGRYPSTSKEMIEYEVAILQLSAVGNPGQIESLFTSRGDRSNLAKMAKDVENALLYALSNGMSAEIRERAAAGLEKMGSERVQDILERIANRHGEESEIGALASDTLSKIRGRDIMDTAIEIMPMKKPPLPGPAVRAAAPAQKLSQ